MLRFALNSIESVIRKSIYISIISSDMQNLYYGICGTFLKSAFGATMVTQESRTFNRSRKAQIGSKCSI